MALRAAASTGLTTTVVPAIGSFTIYGWHKVESDAGSSNLQAVATITRAGAPLDTGVVWESGTSGTPGTAAVVSFDGTNLNVASLASRPAVGEWAFWYMRCSGTGAGLLQVGWRRPQDRAWVTQSTTLAASASFTAATVYIPQVSAGGSLSDSSSAHWTLSRTVLTDTELQALMDVPGKMPRGGRIGYWPLLGSSLGQASIDYSGANTTLSAAGAPTANTLGPPLRPARKAVKRKTLGLAQVSAAGTAALTGVTGTGSVGTVKAATDKPLTGNTGTGSAGTVTAASSLALTGNTGTGSVGTVAPSVTVALSGVTGTGSAGNVSAGSDVTAALTGVSATGSVGTLSPATAVPLTAVSGTGSAGTVAPSASVALTGTTGTGSAGTVSPAAVVALTGVTGTGSAGTVKAAPSVALTGVTGTGSAGTVAPGAAVALTGVSGTGSIGTLAPSTVIGLSGTSATGSVGTVTVAGSPDVTAALTGVSASGSVGSVAPAVSVALSGVAGTGSAGSVSATSSKALTAVSATGSAGSVSPATVVGLTGTTATGTVGSVAVFTADVTIALTGVSAITSAGSVVPIGGDTGGAGGSYGKEKKRYTVKRGDELLVFATKQQALEVLLADAVPKTKKQKAKAVPEPAERISLPEVKAYAEKTGQSEAFDAAYVKEQNDKLVAMFEQMRDDEEVEELLLHEVNRQHQVAHVLFQMVKAIGMQ